MRGQNISDDWWTFIVFAWESFLDWLGQISEHDENLVVLICAIVLFAFLSAVLNMLSEAAKRRRGGYYESGHWIYPIKEKK